MESVDVRIFKTSCHVPKVFPLTQWFRATSIPAPWTTCLWTGRTNSSYGFWWWQAGYCPTWQWFLSIFLSSHPSGLKNPWNKIIYSNDSRHSTTAILSAMEEGGKATRSFIIYKRQRILVSILFNFNILRMEFNII